MPQGDKQGNILEETGVEKKDIYLWCAGMECFPIPVGFREKNGDVKDIEE